MRKLSAGLFASLVVLCGAASASAAPGKAGLPMVNGLSARIGAVTRLQPRGIQISMVLTWTSPDAAWGLRGAEPMQIYFWSKNVRNYAGIQQTVLSEAFRTHKTKQTTAIVTAFVPPGATAVSLALGNSGLETVRAKLP